MYHVSCTPFKADGFAALGDMLSEPNDFCDGWSALDESSKSVAKKSINLMDAPRIPTAAPARAVGTLPEQFSLDEEMEGAPNTPLPSIVFPTAYPKIGPGYQEPDDDEDAKTPTCPPNLPAP